MVALVTNNFILDSIPGALLQMETTSILRKERRFNRVYTTITPEYLTSSKLGGCNFRGDWSTVKKLKGQSELNVNSQSIPGPALELP